MAFAPSSAHGASFLAVGDRSGTIRLLPIGPPSELDRLRSLRTPSLNPRQWPAHHGRIYSLAYTPGGSYLASAGEDGRLLLWPASDPAESHRVSDTVVDGARFVDDDHFVIAGKCLTLNLVKSLQVKNSIVDRGEFHSPCVAAKAHLILAIYDEGRAIGGWRPDGAWDGTYWHTSDDGRAVDFDATPDGRRLAIAIKSPNGKHHIELHEDRKTLARIPTEQNNATVKITSDGHFAVFDSNNEILVAEASSREGPAHAPRTSRHN